MSNSQFDNQAHMNSVTRPTLALGLLGYLIVVVAPLFVALLFDEQMLTGGIADLGVSVTGMVAFSMVAMQFILVARIPWLETPFGYKALLSVHRVAAVIAALLMCIHIGLSLIHI